MGRSGLGKTIKKQAREKGWNRKTRKHRRLEKRLSERQKRRKAERLLKDFDKK